MVAATDTRDRLLDAAEGLLAERGVEGLSLREIARRAGVSHGAPARHFPGLANLLAHVAAQGFRNLHDAVAAAVADAPAGSDAQARLRRSAHGYVRFAAEHPGQFGLMFREEHLDPTEPALQAAGPAAFEQLVDLVAAAQAEGWHPGTDARVLAGSLWATVHGLATLWRQGVIQSTTGRHELAELLEPTLDLLLGPVSPEAEPRRPSATR